MSDDTPTAIAGPPSAPPAGRFADRAQVILACLEAYQRHRADPERPRAGGPVISPARLTPPTAAEEVSYTLADPVRAALRGRVREIGWQTFVQGGTAEMRRLADHVADHAGRDLSLSVLDKWFDQIGDDRDRWVA